MTKFDKLVIIFIDFLLKIKAKRKFAQEY